MALCEIPITNASLPAAEEVGSMDYTKKPPSAQTGAAFLIPALLSGDHYGVSPDMQAAVYPT
jgi:hypothetical protein